MRSVVITQCASITLKKLQLCTNGYFFVLLLLKLYMRLEDKSTYQMIYFAVSPKFTKMLPIEKCHPLHLCTIRARHMLDTLIIIEL